MTERARPKGAQEYKGNGKQQWEDVTEGTKRLRVPGGWIYVVGYHGTAALTFVPVPEVVGYAV